MIGKAFDERELDCVCYAILNRPKLHTVGTAKDRPTEYRPCSPFCPEKGPLLNEECSELLDVPFELQIMDEGHRVVGIVLNREMGGGR
jgi:hypothetical protein